MMQITIDIPDELIRHFNSDCLENEILESLVIQAYQTEKITSAEVGRILGLASRWAVDAFLKQHQVDLHYDEADLEHDREILRQLREHQMDCQSSSLAHSSTRS
jgi:predicted HTH domain antitoxin